WFLSVFLCFGTALSFVFTEFVLHKYLFAGAIRHTKRRWSPCKYSCSTEHIPSRVRGTPLFRLSLLIRQYGLKRVYPCGIKSPSKNSVGIDRQTTRYRSGWYAEAGDCLSYSRGSTVGWRHGYSTGR